MEIKNVMEIVIACALIVVGTIIGTIFGPFIEEVLVHLPLGKKFFELIDAVRDYLLKKLDQFTDWLGENSNST